MTVTVFLTCLLIMLARVTDISLDTLRMVAVFQGRRLLAAILGFGEAVIFISVVAKVLQNFHHPAYVLAYGSGFAVGTFLGMTVDRYLALGDQLASIFTRRGMEVASTLRAEGYRLTETRGRGRDGEVAVLHVKAPRRKMASLLELARTVDADCFYVVNDVRLSAPTAPASAPARRRLVA
jgi:uncharacterized protein YebE (UPF0316 family)